MSVTGPRQKRANRARVTSLREALPRDQHAGFGDRPYDVPAPPPKVARPRTGARRYVELHCHSAYSFLDGASLPEELAIRAAELGYDALALTDHDGVYGSLEFARTAQHFGLRAITGAEVTVSGVGSTVPPRSAGAGFAGAGAGTAGSHVTLLVETPRGYANLCRILTEAHAGTRRPGREDREPLPPEVPL